jgi:hypothetical protein
MTTLDINPFGPITLFFTGVFFAMLAQTIWAAVSPKLLAWLDKRSLVDIGELYTMESDKLCKLLAGKEITYLASDSSVTFSGVRRFKNNKTMYDGFGQKSYSRYLNSDVRDRDDNNKRKFRNLSVSGILRVEPLWAYHLRMLATPIHFS